MQSFAKSEDIPIPLDIDLDLESLWFAQTRPSFPPRTIDRSKYSYATSGGQVQSGARIIRTFSAVLQNNTTLGRTKIHLTWDNNHPEGVASKQRHILPPEPLDRFKLEKCKER
jgi:hypothetical protein